MPHPVFSSLMQLCESTNAIMHVYLQGYTKCIPYMHTLKGAFFGQKFRTKMGTASNIGPQPLSVVIPISTVKYSLVRYCPNSPSGTA